MSRKNDNQFYAKTKAGQFIDPHTCIFPILKEMPDGSARLVGTGFFITMLGHFVTAKHVIFDVYDIDNNVQKAPLHAVHFVKGSSVLVRDITEISYHNVSDIAVGKMDYHVINATGRPLTNHVPTFTTEIPPLGSSVVTYAYPESDADFRRGELSAFRPSFYSGKMLSHSDEARDRVMVSWPHIETSINVLGGASGGPVFDENGRIFGINCVGGIKDLSYMARVRELLELYVPRFPPPTGPRMVKELAGLNHILFDPPLTIYD